MNFKVKFEETTQEFNARFGTLLPVSDGGYNEGYEDAAAVMRQLIDKSITAYSDDRLLRVEDYALYSCSKLEHIFLPNCTYLGNYAFQNCTSLTEISFPNVTNIGTSYSYAFSRCSNLKRAEFEKLEFLGSYAFQLCSALTSLIIRTPKVCELHGVSALNSSPINTAKGFVYVPDELVTAYKTAENWSIFAAAIKPISELE